MPNGVICGGALDGSNQLGEIVTCHAMTALPFGSGCWANDEAEAKASAAGSSPASKATRQR